MNPTIVLSGVRNSWLTVASTVDFARLAARVSSASRVRAIASLTS